MNYAIGDIHGMFDKLKSLISFIIKKDANPIFIFVGDYINKGQNARQVLDYLKILNTQYKCHYLIGNHEYYWMNHESNKSILDSKGGNETQNSFGYNSYRKTYNYIKTEYSFIFKNLKRYYKKENFIITHSGLNPKKFNKPLNDFTTSDVIFNRFDFLNLRRFYRGKYTIIFGHTAFYSPFYDGYKIGIDTGACYEDQQPLSSFCLESQEFIDSNKNISTLSSINKNIVPIIIMK